MSVREHPCRRDERVGSTSSVLQTAPVHAASQLQLVPAITMHFKKSLTLNRMSSDLSQMPQILPTLFSSLNSLTFASTFFSSAHVWWAAGGIPTAPFSGSCSPYSERLPREVGAGVEAGVEMEGFNFLTFLGGSSLVSEDCSENSHVTV